jgi:hypothetical protein
VNVDGDNNTTYDIQNILKTTKQTFRKPDLITYVQQRCHRIRHVRHMVGAGAQLHSFLTSVLEKEVTGQTDVPAIFPTEK